VKRAVLKTIIEDIQKQMLTYNGFVHGFLELKKQCDSSIKIPDRTLTAKSSRWKSPNASFFQKLVLRSFLVAKSATSDRNLSSIYQQSKESSDERIEEKDKASC